MANSISEKAIKWLVVMIVVLVLGTRANACSCDLRPPPCHDYWRMDAVFIGTVGKVHGNPEHPMGTIEDKVEIKVDKNYRGMSSETAWTYNEGHSCAFHFRSGEKYLFYAGLDSKDKTGFGVSYCTRTARLDQKLIDFDFLDRLDGKAPMHWIWATISTDGYSSRGPAGVKATARGRDFSVSSVSDDNGDLKLEVPSEGTYQVRIHFPKDKTYSGGVRNDRSLWEGQRKIVRGGKMDGRNRYLDYEVTVKPNKCAWIDLPLMNRG